MTGKQVRFVKRLLDFNGLGWMASEYAAEYSKGRTHELANLNHAETNALIDYLKAPDPKRKMIRKILSMAHEMHWELPNGKVDMKRINAWCVKHTPYHKPLDALQADELPRVVSIFTKVYKGFLKQL